MSLPALSTGFQHRHIHSPLPLIPHSNHVSTTVPLTPPLTPASIGHTHTDASTRSPALAIPSDSCPASQQVPKWSSSSNTVEQSLPSPTSPTRPRPKLDLPQPTRFLFVTGIPKDAPVHTLKQAFVPYGDLKGIFVKFQADHGAIILAFYDIRHTIRAHRAINSPTRPFFPGSKRLDAHFINPTELHSLIGHSPFVDATDGTLCIATSPAGQGGELDGPALQSVLAAFGELRVFEATYHAEFFDARDAMSVLGALNGIVIRRQWLYIVPYAATDLNPSFIAADPAAPEHEDADAQNKNTVSFPSTFPPFSPRHYSIGLSLPAAHAPVRTRRMSNIYHFDSTGKPVVLPTPPWPRSISSMASDEAGLAVLDVSSSDSVPLPVSSSASSSSPSSVGSHSQPSTPLLVDYSLPLAHQVTGPETRHHENTPPERYRIDTARIKRGRDTRTTVMIKNIPNKMNDKNLIDFINDVCPLKIDFLYLRMDFSNGCNVGYAFVNFIHVQDLRHFYELKFGTKWNLFSSEKILGMRYATYQGKEALVEKFRSSIVMDQRESWRPKLFYSAGPKQGLPEDFPVPSNVRRKERGVRAGVQPRHRPGGRGGALFNCVE